MTVPLLFGHGSSSTKDLSPAEVTFDGSSSTVAWPFSGGDTNDVCMPAGVGMAGIASTSPRKTGTPGYGMRVPKAKGPVLSSREPRESVRERFNGPPSPVSPWRPAGHSPSEGDIASPGKSLASRAQAEQLRDEVAQLHHLLHQTRELHASEASRLHFQLQESKTALRREQSLREDAERREKVKASQCDQLLKDIGALKQQLQIPKRLSMSGSSQGTSPPTSLKGEDLKVLGSELQQIRQDSQELQNLMAKQHDEELQRLRIDLEEMQQSSRKVHGQLSYLEASQKQQNISEAAAARQLQDRCRSLEHYKEIADAKLQAATEELRLTEAARTKLDQELHQEQAAARQAQMHVERLSLEQKSMILDQTLQEEAQERTASLMKRLAHSEIQREELERKVLQERHQLHLLQQHLDATALSHDRAQDRVGKLEAEAKAVELQQAVECASFWTEQDALRRSERNAAVSEERARQLHSEVKTLESQQEHVRKMQTEVKELRSKKEVAEDTAVELKDQYSFAESKVSQLQDAVSFLQQRVTQTTGTDAKLTEVQMMLRKVLNRYKKLLASNADTQISTVTCESKLSEMEMLMQGVEEEQDALMTVQEHQRMAQQRLESREKALEVEASDEMREAIGLRALLRSTEMRSDQQEVSLKRLMEDVTELNMSQNAMAELQEEIFQLQGKLDNSSALSEAHLGAHTRAENQAQSLQKKWLDARLQCQVAEKELRHCQQHLEQEEQQTVDLDAQQRRHMELAEEAQDTVRKLQIKNQRLELKVASNLRGLDLEEEAQKGLQKALEEAHEELHMLRTEQQTHLAESVGAHVRAQAAAETFEVMCQERAQLHEELQDTKLRFCNLQLEHATEKTESMACRGNLKQLEMKLQTVQRSEHQCVQDYQREAEALQRLEASSQAMTARLMQVEATMENCEAARANELKLQHNKLQYEESHVKDLQSALAGLQSEHEGLLWQFQLERTQSQDRYQDLTKEVHQLRGQEMELKLKAAHNDDMHSLLAQRTQESVYDLQKARDELLACEGHLQAEEEEHRRCREEMRVAQLSADDALRKASQVKLFKEEIQTLEGRLENSSALSEAHLGAHRRTEEEAQSLQKKWSEMRLQCQAAEKKLMQCQHHLKEEEQLAKESEAKERHHLELAEDAQETVRKLQINNQRLEFNITSQSRGMAQEEEALKGLREALEEAHEELHALRSEQQTQVQSALTAQGRAQAAMDSFEAMCQEKAQLHEEFHDTQLRFCNSEMEHAAEKSESLACRGSLKQLEIKLQATMRSEHQHLQDYHHEAESLQRIEANSQALRTRMMQVEAELESCEAAQANESRLQRKRLQHEEAHVKDLQSSLASLQLEHEGLRSQFQLERAESQDRYQDLTKEVYELRAQEMELKRKVAENNEMQSILAQRREDSVQELQIARNELLVCQQHLQAEEEEHRRGRDQIRHAQLSAEDAMRKARASEGDLHSRDALLAQLQDEEAQQLRKNEMLREEVKAFSQRCRSMEVEVAEVAALQFTLREMEMNADVVQQRLEQSQSDLEMQTEEKIRLEDRLTTNQRQLMDAESQLREVQAQCAYWKSQHQSEAQRAREWEVKVEELLHDIQCLQAELAKAQGLPLPSTPLTATTSSRDHRQVQRELDASQRELQLVTIQAKDQAEQLEHDRSMQQNLLATQSRLEVNLHDAEERLEALRAEHSQGHITRARNVEANRHYQEELLALRTAQTTMEAQSEALERSAEQRVQKLSSDLQQLSRQHSALLEESQDQKVRWCASEEEVICLEDLAEKLRKELASEHRASTVQQEEQDEMVLHHEFVARHVETALHIQTQRTEELAMENSNLQSELEELEKRCQGQDEKTAQTLQGALNIEKQLLAVRAKHSHLQDAYKEQRHLRAKEAEDGRVMTKSIVDALKEELGQLREEAAAERAVREEADHLQEEVEEKVRHLHLEELQGFHFEHSALRSAMHLQRRNSTEALEAQRWALRREKQLRKQRYALLMAASEELRGGLMRLKEATDEAADADASVEDQDQQVAEELEQVKLDQQALSESRSVEMEKLARLEEVQQQLKDERRALTPNQQRIEELLVAEGIAKEELEHQEVAVAEEKRRFNEDYKKLEEAHAEERSSRERAEAYHQQVAAETQLLAIDLLKLQGVFEADGESESNFSQGSKGVREGRPLVEVASSEEDASDTEA